MMNAVNYSKSRRALRLSALLCVAAAFCVPQHLIAQNLTNITLDPVRVQDFNGGLGGAADQKVSLGNESATITNISNGKAQTDLNTNFGNLNLVFVREAADVWSLNLPPGCATDVDIQVTFPNGEMVSTLNPSNSSSVAFESFAVEKKFKGIRARSDCQHRGSRYQLPAEAGI